MCGLAGIFGSDWQAHQLEAMQFAQRHRGPDACGMYIDPARLCGLAHNRLSIIDLSEAGRQPMCSADGNLQIILNGEIYNYLELRRELESEFTFRTRTDTEVLLAAFQKWGPAALDKLIGMFAFVVWNERERSGFAARDRFGVKPLYYHTSDTGTVFMSSEIKALHAAGIARYPDESTWSDYLTHGLIDNSEKTFWKNIQKLPAGHFLEWKNGKSRVSKWYDLFDRTGIDLDTRSAETVRDEYRELLKENVRLRFRADVPVGINVSGGLDSSSLLGIIRAIDTSQASVTAYTFATGDERYDEIKWVRQMLAETSHPHQIAWLAANEVPELSNEMMTAQDEPFGGLPTLAYAKLFKLAKENGTTVLLDGNGMDEQWAGYDYYQAEQPVNSAALQGSMESPVRPDCLDPEFRDLAQRAQALKKYPDRLRNLQLRDTTVTKIPRAMRFNDRVSMHYSTELREPFLDHRLFEIALRQPPERKIADGNGKAMLREIVKEIVPQNLAYAPKRPLQTPQREWLRGELRDWAASRIENAFTGFGSGWLDRASVYREWDRFCSGASDNSFYVWQWISLGLCSAGSPSLKAHRHPSFVGARF